MSKSLAYDFVLNMWKSNRVDEYFVNFQVDMNRLTSEEAREILNTPQTKSS